MRRERRLDREEGQGPGGPGGIWDPAMRVGLGLLIACGQ
jgi:hypothetical protein